MVCRTRRECSIKIALERAIANILEKALRLCLKRAEYRGDQGMLHKLINIAGLLKVNSLISTFEAWLSSECVPSPGLRDANVDKFTFFGSVAKDAADSSSS